jgi:hypothetical protein
MNLISASDVKKDDLSRQEGKQCQSFDNKFERNEIEKEYKVQKLVIIIIKTKVLNLLVDIFATSLTIIIIINSFVIV